MYIKNSSSRRLLAAAAAVSLGLGSGMGCHVRTRISKEELLSKCPALKQAASDAAFLDNPKDCGEARELMKKPLIRVDHYLYAQFCEAIPENGRAPLEQVTNEERAFSFQRGNPEDEQVLAKYQAPPPRKNRTVEVYVARDLQVRDSLRAEGRRLSSGGALNRLRCKYGLDGHWEATENALRQLKAQGADGFAAINERALEILRSASQDADFFDWNTPAAHAQTGNDDELGFTISDRDWQEEWVKWTRGHLRSARELARQGKLRDALYLVGYSLHSVQDLASHLGRTNAEHSWNHYVQGQDPDEVKEPREVGTIAQGLTVIVMQEIRKQFGDSWLQLAAYQGPGFPNSERAPLLGKQKKDLTLGAVNAYFKLAGKYELLRQCNIPNLEVRWCQYDSCAPLLAKLWERPL